jgi:TRAP transporter 4TM/12TM fusion protein
MDRASLQRWERADRILDNLTLFVGVLMILYVGMAVFGLVSSSARHYSTFVLFVMVISCFASFKVFIGERLGKRFGEEGYEEEQGGAVMVLGEECHAEKASVVRSKVPLMVWTKGALALIGSVLAITGAAYIVMNADRLERTAPFFDGFDMAMGGVLTVGVLMLTLIHWGPTLTAIVALAIAYFFYGQHIDHPLFWHPAYEPAFVMNYIGLGVTQGLFWFAQTAADDIFFLVIYATTLLGLGMMPMIVEAGRLAGGRIKGGAAAPAIIGSGAVAAVMGTAVSNVVLCGRFTIPLMIRGGYGRPMAAAIEATASTAGQIMPPVLGLAAFLIAAFLGIAYVEVVKAAVLPGVLYLTGVTVGVFVYAKRYDLPRLRERANLNIVWRLIPTFVISFLTVIIMLVNYFSPSMAGLAGIVVALALSVFQGRYRPKLKEMRTALIEGLLLVSLLSLLLIAIGPLGQAFQTTNLSGKLGIWLISVLPDSQIILLIGAAVLSIVLGIGLPTPVAYLIAALAVVPFMIQIGIAPLQAHYFAFYFAVYATLSPPVAESVLAAAKIAGSGFWETGLHSMKLAATTFIIPFAFVFNPEIMAFPNISWKMTWAVAEVLIVQGTSSIFLYGYFTRRLTKIERYGFLLAVLLGYAAIMRPEVVYTYLAYGLTIGLMAWVWSRSAGVAAPVSRKGSGKRTPAV